MKRAPVAQLATGTHTLPASTSRHLCLVLRMRAGDTFIAFDPIALTEAPAEVVHASTDAAVVRIGAVEPAALVADLPIHLIYALAKGDKVDAVVRDATELGATRITVARTSRSVVKLDDQTALAKIERWSRIAEQAARQCGRADPPAVDLLDWETALDGASGDARFVLDVAARDPLGPLLKPVATVFAVGAEGGLSEGELSSAEQRGFHRVNVGRFTLRTETVPAVLLGALRVLR